MKKLPLLLLLLLALSFAVTETRNTTELFVQKTAAATVEVAKDWRTLAILAIVISIILVAIAYATGVGFEMSELRAWASNEMAQLLANALIVLLLIVCLAFIDVIVFMIASSSGINALVPECNGTVTNSSASCLQGITAFYFKDYVDSAKTNAANVVANNMKVARLPGLRLGLYCTSIYCGEIGAMTSFTGFYVLDVDRYSIVFEYWSNLLGFMEAQRFFVEQICFNMGPLLLAAGVVARSFFVTRKLGGLLMAAAIGGMFFLPGMYIFDWLTMDLAVKGDLALEEAQTECPAECSLIPPVAFIQGVQAPNNTIGDEAALYAAFNESDKYKADRLLNGTSQFETGSNSTNTLTYHKVIRSCYYGAAHNCSVACRELPYPTVPLCVNGTMPKDCNAVPEQCRVKRLVQEPDPAASTACPQTCKVVPPLKSDCNYGHCLDSAYDCRQTKSTDLAWRPSKPDAEAWVKQACAWAKDCPANMNASLSCVYVMPPGGTCNELCPDCPAQCRVANVTGADLSEMPIECAGGIGGYQAGLQRNGSNYNVLFSANDDDYYADATSQERLMRRSA